MLQGDHGMTTSKALAAQQVSVIGAGNMGSEIALKYASSGYEVRLIDRSLASLERGKNAIERSLNQGVTKGIFSHEESRDIEKRLSYSHDIKYAKSSSLIVEAIFENMEEKRSLFKALEESCHRDTIFASNTSSLLISDLQEGLKKPQRLLGLHYFFPPAKNRLVELIAGNFSDESLLSQARSMQEKIGKVVIRSKDSPGFIVNRFFVPWLNEGMRIVYENQANMATVDHACRSFFGISMGPFELMNATGPAITFHACSSLANYLGDFYAPCPLIGGPLETQTNWVIEQDIDETKCAAIIERIVAVVGSICKRMVHEEDVASTEDTDLGARVGLLWKKGPFELMQSSK